MRGKWNERHPYVFFYDLEAESDGSLIDIWNQREYLFEQWREKTENFLENYNLIRTPRELGVSGILVCRKKIS